ncbi:FBD, F-box and Leucine Rich Repeat domains containing protein [Arabidopsis thaliana]|uniref:FBD, F-box and Leucine Rich Repeat domains containing protein n=2 Tax=Arabidopsis thaliana TaxID=3702 RepID=F4I1V3_ARATH|nr:FBD, F-box and Leucine Rich Repeat domains containing protein [Arabidopsis thaliana]AEE33279.1 FBD, F-box and Leucine Rich Repeat domains containing protein [Arabidopsis thaliana]|eukprot:NP_175962.1 FBD, F-box and Leucine Rich Repeat domains containing protein [Arabidopsis thaliana]
MFLCVIIPCLCSYLCSLFSWLLGQIPSFLFDKINESWLTSTKRNVEIVKNLMDKISQLPDELLVKVLSFLSTKDAVSTSILSMRWKSLWMWLPKLEYNFRHYSVSEGQGLARFITSSLRVHKAPAIESLSLKFRYGAIGSIKPKDIYLWVSLAVHVSNVRELSLKLFNFAELPTKLPKSLCKCKSIVILKLKDEILVDVPRKVCLPSLKTLFLGRVTYSDANSLHRLLSNCPVLEDLVMERDKIDNLGKLSVIVKSLQRLTLKMSRPCHLDGLKMNSPSLKYLKVIDERLESDSDDESDSDSPRYFYDFEDMPKLEEADFVLTFQNIKKFFGSITSVKRLSLCLGVYTEESLYHEGLVFNQLEQLKICSCDSDWSILLARLLKSSPNLRELEAYVIEDHPNGRTDLPNQWDNQLNCVPTCLLSSLETFRWSEMHGLLQNQMDVAKYILKNARCLKSATIFFPTTYAQETRDEMIEELSLSFQGPETCQVFFH